MLQAAATAAQLLGPALPFHATAEGFGALPPPPGYSYPAGGAGGPLRAQQQRQQQMQYVAATAATGPPRYLGLPPPPPAAGPRGGPEDYDNTPYAPLRPVDPLDPFTLAFARQHPASSALPHTSLSVFPAAGAAGSPYAVWPPPPAYLEATGPASPQRLRHAPQATATASGGGGFAGAADGGGGDADAPLGEVPELDRGVSLHPVGFLSTTLLVDRVSGLAFLPVDAPVPHQAAAGAGPGPGQQQGPSQQQQQLPAGRGAPPGKELHLFGRCVPSPPPTLNVWQEEDAGPGGRCSCTSFLNVAAPPPPRTHSHTHAHTQTPPHPSPNAVSCTPPPPAPNRLLADGSLQRVETPIAAQLFHALDAHLRQRHVRLEEFWAAAAAGGGSLQPQRMQQQVGSYKSRCTAACPALRLRICSHGVPPACSSCARQHENSCFGVSSVHGPSTPDLDARRQQQGSLEASAWRCACTVCHPGHLGSSNVRPTRTPTLWLRPFSCPASAPDCRCRC